MQFEFEAVLRFCFSQFKWLYWKKYSRIKSSLQFFLHPYCTSNLSHYRNYHIDLLGCFLIKNKNKNQLLQKSSVLISDTLSSVMFSYLLNAWSPHKFKLTDTPQIFSRKSLMFETLSTIHSNSSHTQLQLWEPSLTCTPKGGILIQKSNSKSIGASFLSF